MKLSGYLTAIKELKDAKRDVLSGSSEATRLKLKELFSLKEVVFAYLKEEPYFLLIEKKRKQDCGGYVLQIYLLLITIKVFSES